MVKVPAPTTMFSQDKKISKPKKIWWRRYRPQRRCTPRKMRWRSCLLACASSWQGVHRKETKLPWQKKRQNHADKKETKFYYSIIQFVNWKEADSMLANGMISTNLCSRKALALEEEVWRRREIGGRSTGRRSSRRGRRRRRRLSSRQVPILFFLASLRSEKVKAISEKFNL